MAYDIPYEIPYLLDDRRIDPHHWMRDFNNKFILRAFNTTEYTHFFLAPLNKLIGSLIKEMESKLEMDVSSSQKQVGDYVYYYAYEANNNSPSYFRKKIGETREEKIITWENKNVLNFVPSPNGKYLLFVLDEKGTQFGSIALYNFEKGAVSIFEKEEVNNGNILWNDAGDAFWYVKANALKRGDKIVYQPLDGSPSVIYQEKDIRYELEIVKDRNFLYRISSAIDATEIANIDKKNHERVIVSRAEKCLAKLIPSQDETYLLLHKENENGALHRISSNDHHELVFESKNEYLINAVSLSDYFILEARENGLPALKTLSKSDFSLKKIDLPLGKIELKDFNYDKSTVTIEHSSPILAPQTHRFCCKSHRFDKPFICENENFEIKQEFAMSDGFKIPITLIAKKGVVKNSQNPLLVYGYGAYGSVIDPGFYKPYSSLLDRGVILAFAHVRGGGEFGEMWHEAGKKERKIASFKDLIAVSEYLIKEGYTSPHKMALQGGSAGGTLAAGAINMRPDLFRVVLLEMPFVDAITDLTDPTIPYTPQEWEEWGNPIHLKELEAIKEWSPIDNIKPGVKPAVYITAGLNDVQVPSYEPYKYFAKLKKNQTGKNPILFELIKGGHKGDIGRYSSIRQIAPMYAFLLNQLGIDR